MIHRELTKRFTRRKVLQHSATTGGALAAAGLLATKEVRGSTTWTPDPSFYPSAEMAMAAPREHLAYVAHINPTGDGRPTPSPSLDLDPSSATYGHSSSAGSTCPYAGDELHHFGWNACSSALCPYAAAPARGAALPDRAGPAARRASTSSTPSPTRARRSS